MTQDEARSLLSLVEWAVDALKRSDHSTQESMRKLLALETRIRRYSLLDDEGGPARGA